MIEKKTEIKKYIYKGRKTTKDGKHEDITELKHIPALSFTISEERYTKWKRAFYIRYIMDIGRNENANIKWKVSYDLNQTIVEENFIIGKTERNNKTKKTVIVKGASRNEWHNLEFYLLQNIVNITIDAYNIMDTYVQVTNEDIRKLIFTEDRIEMTDEDMIDEIAEVIVKGTLSIIMKTDMEKYQKISRYEIDVKNKKNNKKKKLLR